jgi:hypothetical protein
LCVLFNPLERCGIVVPPKHWLWRAVSGVAASMPVSKRFLSTSTECTQDLSITLLLLLLLLADSLVQWNEKVFHSHVWNKKVFHLHAWNKKVFIPLSHVWIVLGFKKILLRPYMGVGQLLGGGGGLAKIVDTFFNAQIFSKKKKKKKLLLLLFKKQI